MDFLVSILIFAAVAFLNGGRNAKNSANRRRGRRPNQSSKEEQMPDASGQLKQSQSQTMAPQPSAKTKGAQLEPGDLMRELARQFGLEEMIPKSSGKSVVGQPLSEEHGGTGHSEGAGSSTKQKTKTKSRQKPAKTGNQAAAQQSAAFSFEGVESEYPGPRMASMFDDYTPLASQLKSSLHSTQKPAKESAQKLVQSPASKMTPVKAMVTNRIGAGNQSSFAQGMLWSQVLGEPRCRKPVYQGGYGSKASQK
jgi:hypothetical protein